jgi:hypothetical protein
MGLVFSKLAAQLANQEINVLPDKAVDSKYGGERAAVIHRWVFS